MNYCIDPTADEPIMLINQHIGYDDEEGMGIDGAIFQQELLQLDTLGKKRIQVWINSVGGIVTDGYSIYNAILKSKTPVDTYAIGSCASIAAVIFQAGRKRIMADYAWLMYHNPFGTKDKGIINIMTESIITMISQRCGMSTDDVSKMMDRTSYITAEEALTMGLCDSIEESKQANTKYLRNVENVLDFHKECNKVLNSIINTPPKKEKRMELKLVTNRLKLNDAATEDSILKAIEAIENRAKEAEQNLTSYRNEMADAVKNAESEMDKLKAKLAKAEEAAKNANADLEKCKAEIDAMNEDKAKAEDEAKAEKAKNMIEDFAKIGRIKNEATEILKWTNTALKLGLDEVKAMIEALPLNKPAEKIETVINKVDAPTSAVSLAAKLRAERNK
jgi:ATP-dependent Clp endopeptidase proteolytic subunit ClpP